MPDWAKEVAKHRDNFPNTVLLVVAQPGVKMYWEFLHAVQAPHFYVGLSAVGEVEIYRPTHSFTGANWDEASEVSTSKCNYADMAVVAYIPGDCDEKIVVIPGCAHLAPPRS